MGITEQLIFPEIDYDKVDRTRGMDITVVTTADNNEDAFALLVCAGLPLQGQVGCLIPRAYLHPRGSAGRG